MTKVQKSEIALENKVEDKKSILIRLLIFIALSFVPLMIMVPIANQALGEKLFTNMAEHYNVIIFVSMIGMLTPSFAHLLTRLLTKEGFANTYLWLNLKGNGKYYLAPIWVVLASSILSGALFWLVETPEFGFFDVYHVDSYGEPFAIIILLIGNILFNFFPYFGEEWGWRGYMMPKLIKLMGKPAAIIVGGIIWGLWHAPLTVSGHNFGVDYPGFPYVGILLMCVFCTCWNAFLTYITERSKSIYPATLCHGIINSLGMVNWMNIFGSEKYLEKLESYTSYEAFIYMTIALLPIAVVSMAYFKKQ